MTFAVHLSSALLSILFVAQGVALATEWQIDPSPTTVTFVARMSGARVKGTFTKVDGLVQMDDIDPHRSTFEIVVGAASVSTGDSARDEYLKSPGFFDAATWPTITFKATAIKAVGKKKYQVTGELSMRGASHPLTLAVDGSAPPVQDAARHLRRTVVARGKIKRTLWELGGKAPLEHGGATVADDVTLEVKAVMILINPGGGPAVQPPLPPPPSPASKRARP